MSGTRMQGFVDAKDLENFFHGDWWGAEHSAPPSPAAAGQGNTTGQQESRRAMPRRPAAPPATPGENPPGRNPSQEGADRPTVTGESQVMMQGGTPQAVGSTTPPPSTQVGAPQPVGTTTPSFVGLPFPGPEMHNGGPTCSPELAAARQELVQALEAIDHAMEATCGDTHETGITTQRCRDAINASLPCGSGSPGALCNGQESCKADTRGTYCYCE